MIMSTHTPLTWSVLACEQCGHAGVPDDHKQLGAVVVGAGPDSPGQVLRRPALTVTGNYPLSSDRRRSVTTWLITKR